MPARSRRPGSFRSMKTQHRVQGSWLRVSFAIALDPAASPSGRTLFGRSLLVLDVLSQA